LRGRLGDRNCPLRRGFRGAPAEFHARTRCCNRPLAAVEISFVIGATGSAPAKRLCWNGRRTADSSPGSPMWTRILATDRGCTQNRIHPHHSP
jgi:hypothetical protein